MVIKSLIENTTNNPTLMYQHGLSLYIETKDHKVLFDVGQDDAFIKNAQMMGVDIEGVEALVISHGHYDHGGGLEAFLNINAKAKVYLTEKAFDLYYSKKADGNMKYIGLNRLLKDNPRLVFPKDHERIGDCLEILHNNSRHYSAPLMNHFLYKKVNGAFIPDDFAHEQNLLIHCDGKTVLIAGCAHNGILNILDSYKKNKGSEPNVVIGGYHLSSSSRNSMESVTIINNIGQTFSATESQYYTCHCTGVKAYEMLKEQLGEQICYLSCGMTIHI